MNLKYSLMMAIVIVNYSCKEANKKEDTSVAEKTINAEQVSTAAIDSLSQVVIPYQNQLEFGPIKFSISSPQSPTNNTFTIAPSGFTISNDTMKMDCDGIIVHSEVADIDADNSPELLLVSQNENHKISKAYLFSGNKNKSMSMVSFPEFPADSKENLGYNGYDEYAFVEGSFIHRFPLYENENALNKTRQFQYKLKPGEAMKQLVLLKKIEY